VEDDIHVPDCLTYLVRFGEVGRDELNTEVLYL
jgi:hypothetical protein